MPSVLQLADAKAFLNITVATYDAELQTFIDAAEAAVGRVTGPLQPTAITAVVRGGRTLSLPTTPVISLTSVTDSSGGTITTSDLWATPDGVVSFPSPSSYYGLGLTFMAPYYTVVYQAGRTVSATTNADLYTAVKEMVRHKWATQRGSGTRPGSEPSPVGSAYSFPYAVNELIAPHIQVP